MLAIQKTESTAELLLRYRRLFGTVVNRNAKIDATVFNLDPTQCVRGSVLRPIEGTVCHGCYAFKAYRMYPGVRKSQGGNQQLWVAAKFYGVIDRWVEAIAFQIQTLSDRKHKSGKAGAGYHRWLGAGDVPDPEFLRAVIAVAKATPDIKHWLPTREYTFIPADCELPDNLVIRASANRIDQAPPARFRNTSTVHKDAPAQGHSCPSSAGNSCAQNNCNACWRPEVANVSYGFH